MKWINIIGDDSLSLDSIRNMKHTGAVRAYDISSDRYCIEYPNGHIFYDFDADLTDFQDVIGLLPFEPAAVITMIYKKATECRNELIQPDFPQNAYVDNDSGIVLPLNEYIAIGMPMDE